MEGQIAESQQEVLAVRADRIEAEPVEASDAGQPPLWVRSRDPHDLPGELAADPPRGAGDRVSLGHIGILTNPSRRLSPR